LRVNYRRNDRQERKGQKIRMFELSLRVDGLPKIRNPFKKDVSKIGLPMDKQGIDLENFTFTTTTNGVVQFFSGKDKTGTEYFKTCPPLGLIMFRKSVAYAQGKFSVYKKNAKGEEEEVENGAANLWKQYHEINPLQTGDQFRSALKGIVEVYGYCCVLKVVPDGFEGVRNARGQYWILPPDFTTVSWNKKYLGVGDITECIDKIEFCGDGNTKVPIPLDDVYVYTDLTFSVGSQVIPQSRLFGIRDVLNNIIVNYESKGVLLANRGAQGIFTDASKDGTGTTPLGSKGILELQNQLGRYGLSKNQYKYIITNAQLRFEKITDSPKDLMLSEFLKEDIEMLCIAMGYKYALLFDSDSSTFNNQNQYRKSLYTDVLIPESLNFDRQFNEMLGLKAGEMYWKTEWDHLLVLMDDRKQEADIKKVEVENALSMFKNCAISYGRMLAMLGEKEGVKGWENKFWIELDETERAIFEGQKAVNQNQGGKA